MDQRINHKRNEKKTFEMHEKILNTKLMRYPLWGFFYKNTNHIKC